MILLSLRSDFRSTSNLTSRPWLAGGGGVRSGVGESDDRCPGSRCVVKLHFTELPMSKSSSSMSPGSLGLVLFGLSVSLGSVPTTLGGPPSLSVPSMISLLPFLFLPFHQSLTMEGLYPWTQEIQSLYVPESFHCM